MANAEATLALVEIVPGTLYVVSTPIGNLEDITLRAISVLRKVDEVLCEDTRHSSRLFQAHAIEVRTSAYHDHNKERRTPELVERLKNGASFAVICDAGTPGVSDEAFYLVRACRREDVSVVPIPGAAAFLSAIVCSGLPTDRFSFEGFLGRKKSERARQFEAIRGTKRTGCWYVSPYQVRTACEELAVLFPESPVVLARELTKLHEQFLRGTAAEILAGLPKEPKGEFVLLFHPGQD
ncbi:MAG: hypothetical protein RL318_3062 [Fibrobacterota bacterium]|jgi:16S rRNA (cytidine1402-2'-O)-methyltransferase